MAFDVVLTTGVDIAQASADIKRLATQFEENVRAFERPIAPKIDTAALRKSVQDLAASFGSLQGDLNKSVSTQKAALAAMAAAGQKGSAEYEKLAATVRKDIQELNRLEQVAREVDAELSDPIEIEVDTNGAQSKLQGLFGLARFNQLGQAVASVSEAFREVIDVGVEYEASLAAVGAITGQSGDALNELGEKARALALQFGGSATSQLASFQGILSKLGPQVADNSAALAKLATNVNVLSAASGDAADTSMNAIVDSMLQFGLVSGDSAKDAETSTRIINGLAASAQVGAAEIPQVAQAILQAGVAAKGAQQSFESTNAAIQVLAVGGKTGSEAGIALRNVLGLIQKASGPAEEAMRKMGTSSRELGELLTTKGLDVALEKLKGGMNNLGSAAERNAALMTIFGTENSAAAGILLDNVDKFKEFEEGIIAGQAGMGAAFEQAAIRMDTAQTSMQKAQAAVKEAFISIFQTVGPGIASLLGTTAQIAPMVQTLSGLKDILPTNLFSKAAAGLKSILIPALLQLGIIRQTNVATVAAETAAETVNTVAKGAQATATGGATVAQYALNTAMLANPAVLVVAGIAALAGAIILFTSSTKDLKEATEDANQALADFQQASAIASGAQRQQTELQKLSAEYERLKNATDPESQKRFADVAQDLAQKVPEASVAVDKLNESGIWVGTTFEVNTDVVRAFADEQVRLANAAKAEALANLSTEAQALAESYREALDEQQSLREDQKELQSVISAGFGDVHNAEALNPFETVKDSLVDVNAELVEQNKKIAEARPEIARVINGYLEMGASVDQITRDTGFTVDEIKRLDPAIGAAVVQAQALDKAIAGVNPSQQESLRIISQQAQAFKSAQDAVDDLNAKIASQSVLGLDTADLEKQLQEAQQSLRENKIKLEATIETKGGDQLFASLSDDVKRKLGDVTDVVDESIDDMREKAANAKLGDALAKGVEIKQAIDRNDELGKFIERYKAAKTETERNSIAAEIARDIPQAISGYDKLSDTFTISTDRAEEFVAAQRKGYGDDIAKKRDEFTAGLKAQAQEFAENSKKVEDLGRKIAQISASGGDVSKYREQWERAKEKTEENAKAIATTVDQGRKIGFVTGEVSNLASELGLAESEATAVAQANARIESSADNAAQSVKEIAEQYKKAREEANGIADDTRGALLGLLLEQRKLQRLSAAELTEENKKRLQELPELIRKARADALQAIRDRKDLERLELGVDLDLGNTERKVKSFRDQAQQVRDEIAGIQRGIRTARIGDELEAQLADADSALAAAQTSVRRQIDKLRRDVAEARRDPAQSVEGAGELEAALQAKIVALAQQAEQNKEKIRADARKKRLDELKRQLADESKAQEENTKTIIDLLKIDEEAIVGESSEALRKRFDLRRRISEQEQRVEIDGLVRSNQEYINAYADLAEARAIIASASATAEQKGAARARIAGLEQSLVDVEARLRESDARITATRRRFEAERSRDEATTTAQIIAKTEDERIARIVDELERERQTRLLAVDRRLREELEIAGDSEELKTAALKRAAQERFKIEQEFREKTDDLYFAGVNLLRSLHDSKFDEDRRRRRQEINEERRKLDQEEQDLRSSLNRRQIALGDFYSARAELSARRRKLEQEAADQEFDLWRTAAAAASEAFVRIQQRYNELTIERLNVSSAAINQVVTDGLAKGESFGTIAANAFEKLEDVGVATLGTVSAQIAALAVSTRATLTDIASSVALTLINIAENTVAANIVAIYATAIGLLGPIGGAAAATGAIVFVEGLLATAKAQLQSNLPEFAHGGFTGNGGKWDVAGVVHKGEFVFDQETTARFREIFDAIHAGRIRNQRELSESVISAQGEWIQAQRRQRAIERPPSRYDRRMIERRTSPIVVVMREQNRGPIVVEQFPKLLERVGVVEKELSSVNSGIRNLAARYESHTRVRVDGELKMKSGTIEAELRQNARRANAT